MAIVAAGVAVAEPKIAQAIIHHKPKASPNPKKLWEKKPPKHKPQKEGLLPLNKWFEHHKDGKGGHGGHGGGCPHCGH